MISDDLDRALCLALGASKRAFRKIRFASNRRADNSEIFSIAAGAEKDIEAALDEYILRVSERQKFQSLEQRISELEKRK